MRVGLLGGSFDPVHYGHLRAAEWAKDAFSLDVVKLMPARQSPFKDETVASGQDRLAMLGLATADNDALGVESSELDRDAPSYTVDTLRALTQKNPDTTFALILGSDAASGLDQWRESAEVRQLAEIRILNRPERGLDDIAPSAPAFVGLPISSTVIRSLAKTGQSIRYLTPEPVRLYIEEKGLYK